MPKRISRRTVPKNGGGWIERDPGSNLPYTPRYLSYPANTPYTTPDAPPASIRPPVSPDPSDPCPPESDPDSDSRGGAEGGYATGANSFGGEE